MIKSNLIIINGYMSSLIFGLFVLMLYLKKETELDLLVRFVTCFFLSLEKFVRKEHETYAAE